MYCGVVSPVCTISDADRPLASSFAYKILRQAGMRRPGVFSPHRFCVAFAALCEEHHVAYSQVPENQRFAFRVRVWKKIIGDLPLDEI